MYRKLAFSYLILGTAFALMTSVLVASVRAGQNIVVVLDDSGSMDERMRSDWSVTKMAAAKKALLTVLEKMPADAKVGIVLLNGDRQGSRWAYPPATVDMKKLTKAIQRIRPGGTTPLGERMKEGCDALLALRSQEHYGKYRLLIVTDGEANDPGMIDRYLPDILSRGIWVDVIGVDMDGEHSLATQVQTYRKADSPADLEQVMAEVLAESSSDPGDAAESDFAMIASIPDEVAAAALESLAESGNHPIGERPKGARADQLAGQIPGQNDLGPDASSPAPGQDADEPPQDEPPQDGGGGSRKINWAIFILMIILLGRFLRSGARHRRERR